MGPHDLEESLYKAFDTFFVRWDAQRWERLAAQVDECEPLSVKVELEATD
jgi:hypothetical protein